MVILFNYDRKLYKPLLPNETMATNEPKRKHDTCSPKREPELKSYAITETEKDVLLVIYHSDSALNAYEVYKKIVVTDALRYIKRKYSADTEIKKTIESLYFLFNDIPAKWVEETIVGKVPTKKTEFVKWTTRLSKDGIIRVSTYNMIVRILKDFSSSPFDWVKSRRDATGKATALYYMDNEMRDKIKKEINPPVDFEMGNKIKQEVENARRI